MSTRYLDGPRPRLFAHRGASADWPENTLEAFRAGIADGADRLELDVHATRDGEVVVIHDAEVDRTTDGQGSVRTLTLDQVRRLDAGFRFAGAGGTHPHRGCGIRIPTLADVLAALPEVPINVEVKQADPPIVARVLAVLDAYDARERTLLAAERHDVMQAIRQAAPDVLTSHSAVEVADFVGRVAAGGLAGYRPPGVAFQVPPAHQGLVIVSAESVGIAHELGAEVHVWTINDAGEMERLLDLGVDAIMTDRPALGARVLASRRGAASA